LTGEVLCDRGRTGAFTAVTLQELGYRNAEHPSAAATVPHKLARWREFFIAAAPASSPE
jgi:hypothetical protein